MSRQPVSPTLANSIPVGVWVLGFVSLLMDVSSEMIHSLLPVFLVSVLGASALNVGIIEGFAEATALVSKVFSGTLSDWLGRRKALTLAGYLLGALSKPLFALAPTVGWIFSARFIDRIGKGMRGAPRDALIADITPPSRRGAAFGLRQSLDTVGAFVGPLLAVLLMTLTAGNFRAVFWVAVIPGLLAVVLLATAVREPVRHNREKPRFPIRRDLLGRLGAAYWMVLAVGMVFSLARFSEAFLLLRASDVGVRAALVPLMLVLMNVVYALTAYPAGHWSDQYGRRRLLFSGMLVLIVSDLLLARMNGIGGIAAGIALWGLHMGLTQGLLAAMVADSVPAELRGTAFGVFGLATGVATLLASVCAGWLWSSWGAPTTFIAGAVFAGIALGGLLLVRRAGYGDRG